MRIDQLLNEDVDPMARLRELQIFINKNCSQYYKFHTESGKGKFLTHSGDPLSEDIFQVVENKTDRKPTDTPPRYHHYVDKILQDKFGIKFRSNSLFVYPNASLNLHSNNYLVVPVDGFQMLSAPDIKDLYLNIKDSSDNFKNDNVRSYLLDFEYKALGDEGIEKLGSQFRRVVDNCIVLKSGPTHRLAYNDPNFPESGDKLIEILKEKFPDIMTSRIEDIGLDNMVAYANEFLRKVDKEVLTKLDEIIESYHLIHSGKDIPERGMDGESEIMIHSPRFVFVHSREIYDVLDGDRRDEFRYNPIEFIYNGKF